MSFEKKKWVPLPKKTSWHLYSLQALQPEKFVRALNKVLSREHVLVK